MEEHYEDQSEITAQVTRNFRQKLSAYEYRSPASSPAKATRSTRNGSFVSGAVQESEAGPSTPVKRPRISRKARPGTECESDDELPALGVESLSKSPKRRKVGTSSSEGIDTPKTLKEKSASPRKGKKPSRPYAPPETYAHLHMLPDYLEYNLDVMFCGINPGVTSAERGHHYAHSTNHFWECLHKSGLTDRQLPPEEDYTLPEKYNFGLTNLVDRPSAEQSELSRDEMQESVCVLMSKIAKYRPRIVCFLAKSIWEVFIKEAFRMVSPSPDSSEPTPSEQGPTASSSQSPRTQGASRFFDGADTKPDSVVTPTKRKATGSGKQKSVSRRVQVPKYTFAFGLQPFKVVHTHIITHEAPSAVQETLFFVAPSPSARVVAYQWWDKVRFFEELKVLVAKCSAGEVDTSEMHRIPHERATSQSIYWMQSIPH